MTALNRFWASLLAHENLRLQGPTGDFVKSKGFADKVVRLWVAEKGPYKRIIGSHAHPLITEKFQGARLATVAEPTLWHRDYRLSARPFAAVQPRLVTVGNPEGAVGYFVPALLLPMIGSTGSSDFASRTEWLGALRPRTIESAAEPNLGLSTQKPVLRSDALTRQYSKYASLFSGPSAISNPAQPVRLIRRISSYVSVEFTPNQRDLALRNLAHAIERLRALGPFDVVFEDLPVYATQLDRLGIAGPFKAATSSIDTDTRMTGTRSNRLVDSAAAANSAGGLTVTLTKTDLPILGQTAPLDAFKDWCFSVLLTQIDPDPASNNGPTEVRRLYTRFGQTPAHSAPVQGVLSFDPTAYLANPEAFQTLQLDLRIQGSLDDFLTTQSLALTESEVMA